MKYPCGPQSCWPATGVPSRISEQGTLTSQLHGSGILGEVIVWLRAQQVAGAQESADTIHPQPFTHLVCLTV